jgi:hypothetical protein
MLRPEYPHFCDGHHIALAHRPIWSEHPKGEQKQPTEIHFGSCVMNNSTMHSADRVTHLKIVAVSLVLGIVVVGIGIAARPTLPDMGAQLEARAPVLKAGQPSQWSVSETSTIR